MTAFTEAAGLPGGVRWGANVRGYLQLATYVYKVCRDPVVKGGSAMVAPVPHPTIARDYCLAPARGIDAPQQGTSSKYQGAPGDLPRNAQGMALIGDPRNDVHLFVSQLHLAMLKVHNLLVDRLRED